MHGERDDGPPPISAAQINPTARGPRPRPGLRAPSSRPPPPSHRGCGDTPQRRASHNQGIPHRRHPPPPLDSLLRSPSPLRVTLTYPAPTILPASPSPPLSLPPLPPLPPYSLSLGAYAHPRHGPPGRPTTLPRRGRCRRAAAAAAAVADDAPAADGGRLCAARSRSRAAAAWRGAPPYRRAGHRRRCRRHCLCRCCPRRCNGRCRRRRRVGAAAGHGGTDDGRAGWRRRPRRATAGQWRWRWWPWRRGGGRRWPGSGRRGSGGGATRRRVGQEASDGAHVGYGRR